MILQVSCQSHGIDLRLPAPLPDVEQALSALRDGLNPAAPIRISGICGEACGLHQYIQHASLDYEDDVSKLNKLADAVDRMTAQEQHILSGALDAESINGLDDVLRVASSLGQYELIEGVTCNKELGGWLVEHGLTRVKFPKEVWPCLDYAGIGAEYYVSHGGAYTSNGYVKRREATLEQAGGFTDFDALVRAEMELDGVRDTSFGAVKRFSFPFPQQPEQGQTMY